jgi:hypothetical protein
LKTKTIILLLAGGFIAYNIIVIAYALSFKEGLDRILYVVRYAPWLALSKSLLNWMYKA